MRKTITIETNPLETGMIFNGFEELSNFLGYEKYKQSTLESRLHHYCKWHFNRNDKTVHIDEAFKTVKPFVFHGFYRYEIGEIIKTTTGSIKILDRYKKPNKYIPQFDSITYFCRCLTDNYEFEETEQHIFQGVGCPICSGKRLVPGYKTLYDEHPEVLKYLVNPEDAKKVNSVSDKAKLLCECPECGYRREMSTKQLSRHGFSCPHCSDYISYPNKFIRTMLKQLNIDFEPEKSFDWSGRKAYDEYLSNYSMIIENHGSQHYTGDNSFHISLEKQQQNDDYKLKLAKENGIKHYIIIDCRDSDKDFIRNSVMNSELPILLGFKEENVDWDYCDYYASTNAEIKSVCEEYNKNSNISRLCRIFKHSGDTIRRYLELGTKCGYCDYKKKSNIYNKYFSKPIYSITDDVYFFSKNEVAEYYNAHGLNCTPKSISRCISYHGGAYYDKLFQYISKTEFNNKKKQSLTDSSIVVYGDYFDEKYIKE